MRKPRNTRKTTVHLTKTKINGIPYYCVTWPKGAHGRNRQFFRQKSSAETLLAQKLAEKENYGIAGVSFNEQHRAEYLECSELLKDYPKATIRDAMRLYLVHLQAAKRTCTAAELVTELLEAKKADGASQRYVGDLSSRLTQFSNVFDGKPVAEITSTDIDQWLRNLSGRKTGKRLAATTRNNFRRVLVVAFNFARERGYCTGNPAEKTARAKVIETAVGILSVEQTEKLLESASSTLVPFVAIGAFAGLRRAELERLDWSEVDLRQKLIEVVAAKSKSARRRFVRIRPNLAKWLQPYARTSGLVTPPDYRELLDAARTGAEITEWPHNALRHSFASYHLAQFKDAAALALELGHSNSNLVFQHYRQLVKPKTAKMYWNIAPTRAAKGRKIINFRKVA